MTETLARWQGVTRRYGDVLALDDVSLDVPAGQIVGLLGPNGAGKSTLINLLLGLRRPQAGTVELFGGDPRLPASRMLLGCTPQETALPPTLTVREVLDFVAGHHPDPVPTAPARPRRADHRTGRGRPAPAVAEPPCGPTAGTRVAGSAEPVVGSRSRLWDLTGLAGG